MKARADDPRPLVPHRPPILCIDRVVSVDDAEAVAERDFDAASAAWEPWLLEGLAQTAAVLDSAHALAGGAAQPKKGMLVGARNLRIDRMPAAGETVRYHARVIKQLGALTLIDGSAFVGTERIAAGALKFYVEEI